MAHHEKTGNNSSVTFGVIFALLFFFGVTVAANQYFVGSEGEAVEHATDGDDHAAVSDKHEDSAPQDKHKSTKKKH